MKNWSLLEQSTATGESEAPEEQPVDEASVNEQSEAEEIDANLKTEAEATTESAEVSEEKHDEKAVSVGAEDEIPSEAVHENELEQKTEA